MSVKEILNGNEPWWAKLVTRVGAPMVLLGAVLYFVSGNAAASASNTKSILEILAEHHKSALSAQRTSRRVERFFWIQCVRSSKTPQDLVVCGPDPKEKRED